MRRFDEIARRRFVTSYGYALDYAGLNDKEQALIWLRKAVAERSHWLAHHPTVQDTRDAMEK